MFDGKTFGEEIVGLVREYVAEQLAPLRVELAALVSANAELAAELALLRALPDVAEVTAIVDAALAQLPPAEPGAAGKDADPALVALLVADAVAALPPARDGRDADPAEIANAVRAAVEALPAPRDGADGQDGVGLAGALIDRRGHLVLTLSDGAVRELGLVVGRDGEAGAAGRDGADGLGFDDLEVLHDGERGVTLRFARGEQLREFPLSLPIVLDRGVYKADAEYQRGDAATWGGSLWIAQRQTSARPEASDDWRLAVKRGRDGRDGAAGKDGQPGPKGEPGLNGRSFGG